MTLVHSALTGSIPTALIERLEVASEGSRELDALIYCSAFDGYTYHPAARAYGAHVLHRSGVRTGLSAIGEYTTSLDAALALAGRVLPEATWRVEKDDRGFYAALWSDPDYEPDGCGRAPTPALALCIAILKARTANSVGIAAGDEPKTQPTEDNGR